MQYWPLSQELALRTSEGRSSSNPLIKARCEDAALDMEYTTEITTLSPEPAQYETAYVTSHKSSCRAGAFNADGSLCATGSADASIKVSNGTCQIFLLYFLDFFKFTSSFLKHLRFWTLTECLQSQMVTQLSKDQSKGIQ